MNVKVMRTFKNSYLPPSEREEAWIMLAFPLVVIFMGAALFIPGLLELALNKAGVELNPFGKILLSSLPLQTLLLTAAVAGCALPSGRFTFAERCGLINWKRMYWREVLCVELTILPFLIALAALSWYAMKLMGVEEIKSPIEELLERASVNGLLLLFAVSVFLAPVAEELAFRRIIFGFIRGQFGTAFALVITCLGFAALHGSAAQFLPILMLGLALQLLYIRHNSVFPGILLHFTHNFIVITPIVVWKLFESAAA